MAKAFSSLQIWIFLAGLAFPGTLISAEKWVSTSPQLTELMYQLDVGRFLVGTSEASDYPPAARELPRVGKLFQVNLESVLQLQPTRVFWDQASFQPALHAKLVQLGIGSERLSLKDVNDLFETAQYFLQLTHQRQPSPTFEKAQRLWTQAKQQSLNFKYLALAWMDPPMLFGKQTFFTSLLTSLGATGVFPLQWNTEFLKVSEEWLMAQTPERVIFLSHNEQSTHRFKEKCHQWWPQNTPRCQAVPADHFARASFTSILNLQELNPSSEPNP